MKRIGVGIAGWLLVAAAGCAGAAPQEQIRLDAPAESQHVSNVGRLTDGQRAVEGSPWNSTAAAFFQGNRAYAMFDLGKVTAIEAAYIQGDNNDQFIIETSEDGTEFTILWEASAVSPQGLRARWASGLGGSGRFVRFSAIGGDSRVSVSEDQLFSATPPVWPP